MLMNKNNLRRVLQTVCTRTSKLSLADYQIDVLSVVCNLKYDNDDNNYNNSDK